MKISITFAAAALTVARGVVGHTWIEQLRNIDAQGNYAGEYGYPRGMVSKTDPGYNGFSMNWQLPGNEEKTAPFVSGDSMLCHTSQRGQNQSSSRYPRLQATPGGFMALRYMENGHISKPDVRIGKPEKGGTVFVFGTTQPRPDEKLVDVLQWSTDGSGGNKRGVLLTTNDFDDGRCYEKSSQPISQERQKEYPNWIEGQVSDGPGNAALFCETNVAVPKNATTGKPYTLYWVWQWNTKPNADPGLPKGSDEYYTTCIDVDVVDTIAQTAEAQYALGPQQDAMSVAVKDYRDRTALVTNFMVHEYGPAFNASQPTATDPAASAPAATSPVDAGSQPPVPTLTARPTQPDGAPSAIGGPSTVAGPSPIFVTVTTHVTVTATATATGAPVAKKSEIAHSHAAAHVRSRRVGIRGRFVEIA